MRITTDARISLVLLAVSLLALGAFFWFGFSSIPARQRVRPTLLSRAAEDAGTRFRDITASVGLSSIGHDTGGVHSIRDVIAPGVALLDLDRDKDLDLVVLRGPAAPTGISIYLNRIRERRELWFEDVTREAGVTWRGAAQGICAGDYDNDNDLDLFITVLGRNLLLRSLLQEEGAVRFRDATDESGLAGGEFHFVPATEGRAGRIVSGPVPVVSTPSDRPLNESPEPVPEFSTGASFGDFNRDGHLDLYVANYLSYHPGLLRSDQENGDRGEAVEYQPRPYPAQADRLYLNLRDGTFRDVTREVEIQGVPPGKGLAARFLHLVDLQQWVDHRPDVYVANDASPNQLFLNMSSRDTPRFAEMAIRLGVADVRSGMGLASGDPDGDGDLDLVVTNWRFEPASLFVGISDGHSPDLAHFDDQSQSFHLAGPTEPYVGWGAVFFDYDLDGHQDLAIANGFTSPAAADLTCTPEPLLLLRNLQGHRFRDVSSSAGAPFQERYNGRGLVAGDLDLDGDLDLVMSQNNGTLVILSNELTRPQGRLFTFDDFPPSTRADAIGSRLVVEVGARSHMQAVESGSSYLSQGPLELHFGVGLARWLDRVRLFSSHPLVQDQATEHLEVTTWRLD